MAWIVLDESYVRPHVRDPFRYKTVLCRTFERHGSCPYAEKCQYAHGIDELRATPRWMGLSPSFGRVCQWYATTGECPYGYFCKYPHTFDGTWTGVPVPAQPPPQPPLWMQPPLPPLPPSEMCKPCGYATASPRSSSTASTNASLAASTNASSTASSTSTCDDDDRWLEQQLELVLGDWEFVDLEER